MDLKRDILIRHSPLLNRAGEVRKERKGQEEELSLLAGPLPEKLKVVIDDLLLNPKNCCYLYYSNEKRRESL